MAQPLDTRQSFMVSAPGKVIVFGEHAVVHGRAAIAAAISLRSYLLVTKEADPSPNISLTFPDIKLEHAWPIDVLPWASSKHDYGADDMEHAAPQLNPDIVGQLDMLLDHISPEADAKTRHVHRTASKAFLYILLGICNGKPPAAHTFTMRSTVPIGAGLGSSASIAVCIATAALRVIGLISTPGGRPVEVRKREADVINHWAFIGEMIMHGTPSGVDNTVSTLGNAVHFKRPVPTNPPVIIPLTFPTLPLLVVNTHQSRNTSAEVAKVKAYLSKHPAIVNHILDAIDSLTEAAHAIITSTSTSTATNNAKLDQDKDILVSELGQLFRTNHCLLASLGVSHPRLEKIRVLIDEQELGFTKLTGGGGGGCAISLISAFDGTLEKELQDEGFEVHETLLGAKGVGIWEDCVMIPEVFLGIDLEREAQGWGWRYWC